MDSKPWEQDFTLNAVVTWLSRDYGVAMDADDEEQILRKTRQRRPLKMMYSTSMIRANIGDIADNRPIVVQ